MRLPCILIAAAMLRFVLGDSLAATNDLQVPLYYSEIASRFAETFPSEHLSRLPLNDVISGRTWTNYLRTLDPEHLYFRADDIERLRRHETTLDDDLTAGNLDFAFDAYALFKARVSERVAYVNTVLTNGFDLQRDETYRWKRRKAPWPTDARHQDNVWRQKIKNEYVQHVVTRELREKEREEKLRQPDAPPSTNQAATAESDTLEEDQDVDGASPEDTIRKRYRRFLTILADNDSEWVLQNYLTSFAQAFDPHSAYMTPSSSEDFSIDMKLSLVGIGALLRPEDGTAKIVRLIPGGPAQRDERDIRLRPGDMITGVGEDKKPIVDTLHWPLYKVVRLIRGKVGSRVVLRVIPATDSTGTTTKIVDLIRDEVKLEEQAAKAKQREIVNASGETVKLGVIDIPAFYANMQMTLFRMDGAKRSSTDVERLVDELKQAGIKGLLLDIRSNGGGSLLEAIRMSGLFIKAGPIVQVKELRQLRILPDMDRAVAYNGPLVVLVNRLSASASEILAAALQDYGRAVIVGDSKTHGKGTVQTILPLGRDKKLGSIKVTCSSFYRITGEPTQKTGVVSDIKLSSVLDFMEIGEETLPNSIEESVIRPALFRPFGHVRQRVPALRERSLQRRRTDPHYVAYAALLERARQLNETEVVSLNIDKRRQMAVAEKDLQRLQRESEPARLDADGDDGDDKPKRPDLVLDEALKILADLVAEEARAAAARPPENVPASPPNAEDGLTGILRWLKGEP